MSELNTGTATGMYDPTVHENQIVALYEDLARANAAKTTLLGAGVPATAMEVIDGDTDAATQAGTTETVREEGFWGAMKNLFAPDEDVHAYSHAISHGHAMLIVTPDATMDRQHVIHTLESTGPVDFDAKVEQWRNDGYDYAPTRSATAMTQAAGTAATASMATPAALTNTTPMTGVAGSTGDETLKVMEERLRVGKREVAGGAVRIRSYVVERPVEEQVRLRDERVSIERRPVDRPATADDLALFKEHTIEARATSEEAVVSKEARVVEEIGVRKEAGERTETVRDTLRKTEVEVDDQSTTGITGTKTGTMGTGGTVTNATPGATSSGMNAPRPTNPTK